MSDPKDAARDAAARARQDPVLFGPDPFAGQPGWEPPPIAEEDAGELPRPRWPVVAGVLILVVLLVGAVGIWVF
jgi:hypothetical protein